MCPWCWEFVKKTMVGLTAEHECSAKFSTFAGVDFEDPTFYIEE
jgi:hypothetical protein